MKELSIEEKAKAYDEVFKKARLFYKDEHVDNEVNSALEVLFPELKESEDERMWKLIKKYAHYNISDIALEADHITREQLETWLEKQGEQKPAWSEEDEKLLEDTIYMVTMQRNENRSDNEYQRAEKCIEWLKSFKERVLPQNTWKPSDEQIKAVKEAACYSSVFSEKTIDNLISLSKDLKKLKG